MLGLLFDDGVGCDSPIVCCSSSRRISCSIRVAFACRCSIWLVCFCSSFAILSSCCLVCSRRCCIASRFADFSVSISVFRVVAASMLLSGWREVCAGGCVWAL